jgi:hypothetical protein
MDATNAAEPIQDLREDRAEQESGDRFRNRAALLIAPPPPRAARI